MKIIDILTQTADLIGLSRESKILNQTTPETENEVLENEEIGGLFNLMKYSIQELCTNYIPIKASTQIEISNNSYALSNLQNYIYINALTKNNQHFKYKIINRNIMNTATNCFVCSGTCKTSIDRQSRAFFFKECTHNIINHFIIHLCNT